ncbi:MAG: hypothetical protein IKD16_05775, partial [Bacteroidales bacterium]|nr:hypothetical protein [Bacteroidales bacterium]
NPHQKHSEGTFSENTLAIQGKKRTKSSQDDNTKNSQPAPKALRRHIYRKRPCHPRIKTSQNFLGWQHQK